MAQDRQKKTAAKGRQGGGRGRKGSAQGAGKNNASSSQTPAPPQAPATTVEQPAVPTNPLQPTPNDSQTTTKPPRPKTWEIVNLDDASTWNFKDIPPVLFDTLPSRLRKFLIGKDIKKDENRSKNLVVLLRSKLPFYRKVAKVTRSTTAVDGVDDSKHHAFSDEWQPHRVLGAGSFGQVALWVHTNAKGQITDEMAVKDALWEANSVWIGEPKRPGYLATEAVINHHLNGSKVENIVQLRGFKCIGASPEFMRNARMKRKGQRRDDERWRFYMEFAPYGELSRLMARYRAWNKYLPELFLWHVFDGLARAARALNEQTAGPKSPTPSKGNVKRGQKVVHFDIKPENIFLGYEEPFDKRASNNGGIGSVDTKLRNLYPTIKLGDFGISEFLGEGRSDPDNPRQMWHRGTDFYKAPEMIHYGLSWDEPPNGNYIAAVNVFGEGINIVESQETTDDPGMEFGQATNVWNIGKVMYDLVTLSRPWLYSETSAKRYTEYKTNNEHTHKDFTTLPFQKANKHRSELEQPCPYSKELMGCIQECMQPKMKGRLTADDVWQQTQAGLKRHLNSRKQAKKPSKKRESSKPSCTTKRVTRSKSKKQDQDEESENDGQENEIESTDPPSNHKVCYRDNEVNAMVPGEEEFTWPRHIWDGNEDVTRYDVEALLGDNLDPDWEELELPGEQWDDMVAIWKRNKSEEIPNFYWQTHAHDNGSHISFRPPKVKVKPLKTPPQKETQGADVGQEAGPNALKRKDAPDDGVNGSKRRRRNDVEDEDAEANPDNEEEDEALAPLNKSRKEQSMKPAGPRKGGRRRGAQ